MAELLAAFPHGAKMTGKVEGDLKLSGEIAHSLRPLAGIHSLRAKCHADAYFARALGDGVGKHSVETY